MSHSTSPLATPHNSHLESLLAAAIHNTNPNQDPSSASIPTPPILTDGFIHTPAPTASTDPTLQHPDPTSALNGADTHVYLQAGGMDDPSALLGIQLPLEDTTGYQTEQVSVEPTLALGFAEQEHHQHQHTHTHQHAHDHLQPLHLQSHSTQSPLDHQVIPPTLTLSESHPVTLPESNSHSPVHQSRTPGEYMTTLNPDEEMGMGLSNVISDALIGKTKEEIDDLKRRIVDRLESLLSPASLPHDKLLFSLSLRNSSGWIPLSTLIKYPRIRSYADTYGVGFLVESVRASNDPNYISAGMTLASAGQGEGRGFLGRGKEGELIVDGKGERVRRKEIVLKSDTGWDRTVYAEGFGLLDPTTTTTQDAIEEWFEQFAPITVVRFRRGRDPFGGKGRGDFRGSVFCEFKTVEGAELFLRTNPKPLFNGNEILAMIKENYLDSRLQLKALRHSNVIPLEQVDPETFINIDKGLLKLGGGKKRKREDEEEGPAVSRRTNVLYILFNKHRVSVNRKTGQVLNKHELVYPERALLKFTGAGETGDWKVLKEDLVNAEIEHSFLYLPRNSSTGYFAAPEAIGDEVVERLRNLHLIVGDSEIDWERVEGQEERDFYARRASFQGKLAVKMADEKEALENDAIKETSKEIRNFKDRERGKSVLNGSGKKKVSVGSVGNGRKSKSQESLHGGMEM